MASELGNFLKAHLQRSGNGLVQLILVNGLVFIGLLLIKTGLVLLGYEGAYQVLYQHVVLPTTWQALLNQPWSLLSYSWVHESFWELTWQLLLLYSFGQLILYRLGSKRLLLLYILGGLLGGLCCLLVYHIAPGFQGMPGAVAGASASLYAIMAAATTLFPHFYFHLLLVGRIRIPYILGGLLLLSCFEISQHQAVGVANLSGALVGYVWVHVRGLWPSIARFFRPIRKNGFVPVNYPEGQRTRSAKRTNLENQVVIDQLLDKIAQSGYQSLTREEKQQLFEAGQ